MTDTENDLKPEESVFRFLFASPAYFVGECHGKGYYLSVAFQAQRWQLGTQYAGDSTFILSIRTPQHDKKSIVFDTYGLVGEEVSALLGAFYGKLVVNLGHTQCGFVFMVPTACRTSIVDKVRMPFNSDIRKPRGPALNLAVSQPVIERYIAYQTNEQTITILRAAEFYRSALENVHNRPEISLALFCSTLEALLPLRTYTNYEIYDEAIAEAFVAIATYCPKGDRLVRGLKSRLFQIKRKIAVLVAQYIPDDFFVEREAIDTPAVVRDRSELVARVRQIYDIRSKVLHMGDRSGIGYLAHEWQRSEIGLGTPSPDTMGLAKALSLTGLERVVSTVLRGVIAEWLTVKMTSE